MKQFFQLAIFSIIFLITACSKKDSQPSVTQSIKITKADYGSIGNFTYTYDANKNMATETYSGDGTPSNVPYVVTMTNYDTKGRLTEYNIDYPSGSFSDLKYSISYTTDGRPERIVSFDINTGAYAGYSSWEYLVGKIIFKRYGLTNTLQSRNEYTLAADGNNVAELKTYNAAGTLTSTTTYSNYDAKFTVESLYPIGYSIGNLSKNNFTTLSRVNNVSGTTSGFSVTFEYNDEGYPIKRTLSSGTVQTFTYTKL